MTKQKIPPIEDTLLAFVHDFEVTGGIYRDSQGYPRPCADPDWIDLGETYLKACQALGREPAIVVGEYPAEDP